jgi:hypothetical protein
MNTSEIVKHILEAEEEEFDPREFVKSASQRESAVEIYNGPLVRVIQPLHAFTVNNYLDGGEIDEKGFADMTASGPIYIAVDKADHDNMAIIQPSSGRLWNIEGREQEWKALPEMIAAEKPTSKWQDAKNFNEDRNWLDLQNGLATFFMSQIAKKKNVGQWVKYLTMIGRTDLATNYARYLGRAKLPFGKSVDAVLAMKKAGKRSRNRIARLMQSQKNVKWGERGFWLLFDDWVDLAPFYGESRNYDYKANAEKIFGGDTHEWFDQAETKPEEVWDSISDNNMSLIRQLLVNRTVYNSEGEEHLVTKENVSELDDGEIKDIVCDRGNKGGAAEDIYDAIRYAANDAYVSQMEGAYYEGYKDALLKEWGLQWDKTAKWIGVGKKEPDKKLEGGMVQKGQQKTMLGLWFPYSELEQWIAKWKEDEYEDDYYGDIHDLALAYLEKVTPNDEYWGNMDDDYFNERLDYHLNELELTTPEKQVDPNQPELPLEGEPDPQAGELEKNYTVTVGSHPDEKVYKGIPKSEATKYREAMKPTRDDISFRAESFLAIPLDRIDERLADKKIEFEASDEAAESLVPLLKELRKMGSQGSSRNIKIEDWDGKSSFGFDGDGASKIGEIKVDGQVVESQLLQEAIYKRSTTQIDLPKEIGQHIISWGELNIADEDLYIDEKDGCGRETEQHVTVLYGILDSTPSEALIQIVENTKPFLIEFGGVSIFETEKYDVVKLDIISEELHNLHLEIRRSCPNDNKFPDYKPHCTIAYLQKGKGKKYAGQDVFKTAQVPRDFWAYDLKFKGAGDSEDGNRVVQLISFDKSKDFEREEPEAGEQRYPEATRDEEEPELAVAESAEDDAARAKLVGHLKDIGLEPVPHDELKALLDRNVPVACPECHSHNLSTPDEEGLVDCFDCGIWFDPLHPENKPVAESDEVDPKKFTEKPELGLDLRDWQLVGFDQQKKKGTYRHKNGRVQFKYHWLGKDRWRVFVNSYPDDTLMSDYEDFRAASLDEAQATAMNLAYDMVHSTNPLLFDPIQEAEEINAKEFLNRTTNYRIRRGVGAQTRYLHFEPGTGAFKWVDFDDASIFDSDKAGELIDWVGDVYGGQRVVAELVESEGGELDPKAFISKIPHHELQPWDEAGPEGGYRCSCGQWRYKLTGWSSSIPHAMREFRAHKRLAAKANNQQVKESMPGPFDEDGLPGEVSSFLRKVRSRRPRKAPKPQVI